MKKVYLNLSIFTIVSIVLAACGSGTCCSGKSRDGSKSTTVTCADTAVGTTIRVDGSKYLVVEDGDGTNGIKNNANLANLSNGTTKFCTSHVTNMSAIFSGNAAFNQAIGDWDTSRVTNMASMFKGAATFNQEIENWDTSRVTNMASMFSGAAVFNQSIGNWKTSNVTSMQNMFYEATAFNQPIGDWDTSNVTNMTNMFSEATTFNQIIENCNTSKVTDMSSMFKDAATFNQELGKWDTSKVTTMKSMFELAPVFNQDLSSWNVASVTNYTNFNKDANANWVANSAYQPKFGVSPAATVTCADATVGTTITQGESTYLVVEDGTSTNGIKNSTNLANLSIGTTKFCTSHVTDMSSLFKDTITFNQAIGNWDTSKVTNMESMFNGAVAFNQAIGNWNTSKVTTMESMFELATAFDQDLSTWDVASVTNYTNFNKDANASWVAKPAYQPKFVPPTTVTCAGDAVGTTITAGGSKYLVVEDGIGTNGIKNNTNLANLSSGTTKFCTSHVTDMSFLFSGDATFNQTIGDWDTSNVTIVNL